MNDELQAALERYDADGYELAAFTERPSAILHRADDWTLVQLYEEGVASVHLNRETARRTPGFRALLGPLVLLMLLGTGLLAAVILLRDSPAPPTAPDTGTILSGTVPRGGGGGLFVFGGGTDDQLLLASGCPRDTAVFWASDGAGGFIPFVPAATVDAVNEPWRLRFASGIPSGTPLIGRCQ